QPEAHWQCGTIDQTRRSLHRHPAADSAPSARYRRSRIQAGGVRRQRDSTPPSPAPPPSPLAGAACLTSRRRRLPLLSPAPPPSPPRNVGVVVLSWRAEASVLAKLRAGVARRGGAARVTAGRRLDPH